MKKKATPDLTSAAHLLIAIGDRTYRVQHKPAIPMTKYERQHQLGSIGRHTVAKKLYSGMIELKSKADTAAGRMRSMQENAKTATLHDFQQATAEHQHFTVEFRKAEQYFLSVIRYLFPKIGNCFCICKGWRIVKPDPGAVAQAGIGLALKSIPLPFSIASIGDDPPASAGPGDHITVTE